MNAAERTGVIAIAVALTVVGTGRFEAQGASAAANVFVSPYSISEPWP